MAVSGNCWKVAQVLRSTGRPFDWVEVDANAGETRTPAFLSLNPAGKIPVAVLDDGTVLRESNAMLAHFAEGTALLPPPGLLRTRVFEWLFFEQYSHEPYIAVARNIISLRRERDAELVRLEHCWERGHAALALMEDRLSGHEWLTDAGLTVADLALFAYTHRADEGEFDLSRTPGVTAWLARVRATPDVIELLAAHR